MPARLTSPPSTPTFARHHGIDKVSMGKMSNESCLFDGHGNSARIFHTENSQSRKLLFGLTPATGSSDRCREASGSHKVITPDVRAGPLSSIFSRRSTRPAVAFRQKADLAKTAHVKRPTSVHVVSRFLNGQFWHFSFVLFPQKTGLS